MPTIYTSDPFSTMRLIWTGHRGGYKFMAVDEEDGARSQRSRHHLSFRTKKYRTPNGVCQSFSVTAAPLE